MATLSIEGRKVKVDDAFLRLSPEEQERQVEELARELRIQGGPKYPIMSQVNRGIADSIGGLVDFINPLDAYTGSAAKGLANVMEGAGIEVAEGQPQGAIEGFARGVGNAAGAVIPTAGTLSAMRAVPGAVGSVASDAYAAMATKGGVAAELAGGGISGAAQTVAADAGLPEWAQTTAAVAAPVGILGALQAARTGFRYLPTSILARKGARAVSAAMAPYSRTGATEVARKRVQSLAGGPERAQELAGRIGGDNPLNLTPAQMTGDENMLALEQLAASQNPVLRQRLEDRLNEGNAAAREGISELGGDVRKGQEALRTRQTEFAQRIEGMADNGLKRAEDRIQALSPRSSETRNSLIVSEELARARDAASAEESRLWDAVPRGAQVGTSKAKETAQALIDATPRAQAADVPSAVRRFLGADGEFDSNETVAEMHGLYSELRRIARSAMAGTDRNENKARIANAVADAILDDLGAVSGTTDIGRKINQARAFSRQLHETFDQGAVGKLMRRTQEGDNAIDPELSLPRTVGRGGATGAVANRQIVGAAGPKVGDAVQDYIKGRFASAVTDPAGKFTFASASRFIRDNDELLAQYPGLRDELMGALKQGQSAQAVEKRVADFIAAAKSPRSGIEKFIGAAPERAIVDTLNAQDPIRAATLLVNAARKDKTGAALAGVKGALAAHLIDAATRTKGGVSQLDGNSLASIIADPKTRAVAGRILDAKETGRLRQIVSALIKADAAGRGTPDIGPSLSGAKPNTLIEYMARVVAARHGASLGGGGGGSLQTAQMASSRVKDALGRLVADRASAILADAVEDPDLFRALLTDMGSPAFEKRTVSRLLPYLIGAGSAVEQEQ